jgi:hypothetical protein
MMLLFFVVTVTTRIFDQALFGLSLVILFPVMAVMMVAIGTAPDNRVIGGWFRRWVSGLLLPFRVEINTEATPPGSWTVNQFQYIYQGRVYNFQLAHSAYDSPQVQAALVHWLQVSEELSRIV